MRSLYYCSEGYPTLSQTFTLREVRGHQMAKAALERR